MLTRDLYHHLSEQFQFFKGNVTLDGINFYYPESLYTPGESPLVLWLKPFMIPDVLQKPVNDQLVYLHRPHDFTNVYEYSQNMLKKNKNKKKKKKNVIHDKMEIDNLVEVSKIVYQKYSPYFPNRRNIITLSVHWCSNSTLSILNYTFFYCENGIHYDSYFIVLIKLAILFYTYTGFDSETG